MRESLHEVPSDHDIVVVGGGINGAGVARDAALRGYRVALVEKDDFGSGASSRSSKLAHGGIRYLEHGAFRLVWEASQERRRLLRLAPHLVRPLPFVLPVYRDSRFGLRRLRAGLWLYDLLAAFRNIQPHRMLSLRDQNAWGNGLRSQGLRGAGQYWDAAMDDARLVLANVIGAREAGAEVRGRASAELRFDAGRVTGVDITDRETDERATWSARMVVACTGPWSNSFLRVLPGAPRPLATTRGSHIIVRRLADRAFTLSAARDGRVFFVLPWLGETLVGTTDLDDESDPDRVQPAEEEIDYLLAETNRYFPRARLGRVDVLAAFAGLRPLLRASGDASARSREHALLEPVPGLLVVAGGKYTTYRAVAEAAVDRVADRIGLSGECRTRRDPLPGGDLPWPATEQWQEGPAFERAADSLATTLGIESSTSRHWYRTYGSHALRLSRLVEGDRELAIPLCPHHPHTRAEVVHCVRSEMALHLEDWFVRRSSTVFTSCHGLDAIEDVASIFARELGWSDAIRSSEIGRWHEILRRIATFEPVDRAST